VFKAMPSSYRTARWVRFVATVGGAGLAPIAPGTMGALVALPFARALGRLTPLGKLAVLAAVTAVSWKAVARYLEQANDSDPQEVVADELVGCLYALALVPASAGWALAAFGLFRALDIKKPGPVGWAERELRGAAGVMGDDMVAGALAGVTLAALRALARRR
jgi:phosphatidylglycerophosphatase A